MNLRIGFYPKSFRGLLAVGFSLVAAPLVFALVNSAISVDRIANQSQQAVYQAVQVTRASRMLSELIISLERIARQYLVLGDASLLQGYVQIREKFLQTAQQFSGLPLGELQKSQLAEILAREQAIYEALSAKPVPSGKAAQQTRVNAVVEGFANLSDLSRAMTTYSNELIDREVNALRTVAGQADRILAWQLIALVPVVLFLVAGFAILIARPIRQLDRGIHRLGVPDFSSEIVVTGPEDLQSLGRRLNWLRLRLKELEEEKARFMRHVSHELKTPLAALREGSDLLAEEVVGPLNPEQKEIARILKDNSLALMKLIEDLLNYNAAQHQKSALNLKPVKMQDIVERVAANHRLALLAKNLALQIRCQDISVKGDEEKLEVIVDNLFSNAVKFSPPGGVIQISLEGRAGRAILDVIDSGPGIPRQERDKVFEPFYQGQIQPATPIKGTGLGLSIVRELVATHQGRVEVVDEPRQGAHLRVTLPLDGEVLV